MAAIIDEEATRLDTLVGDAVEMAEIDAHVVKVQLGSAPAARAARRGRGGIAQGAPNTA